MLTPRTFPCLTRFVAVMLLAAVMATPVVWAEDMGDPLAGRKLAQTWCANCHVFPGSTTATATGAPSFSAIAADKAMTATALRVFLQTPHDRMTDLHLSNTEMDDLITFILSTRGQ